MKIVVIDDNKKLWDSIKKFFEKSGHIVFVYYNKESFMKEKNIIADVYIIDVDLGDGNGMSIVSYLRNTKKSYHPILMISADHGLTTKLKWFKKWADDYIVKPFSPLELNARVISIIDRIERNKIKTIELSYKDMIFNTRNRKFTQNNVEIDLSKKEKQIIEILLENKWELIKKEELAQTVWWDIPDEIQNTMNVSICKLRKKLWEQFIVNTVNWEWYILEE